MIDLRELFSDELLRDARDLLVEQVRDKALPARERRQAAVILLQASAKVARLSPRLAVPVKTQNGVPK